MTRWHRFRLKKDDCCLLDFEGSKFHCWYTGTRIVKKCPKSLLEDELNLNDVYYFYRIDYYGERVVFPVLACVVEDNMKLIRL